MNAKVFRYSFFPTVQYPSFADFYIAEDFIFALRTFYRQHEKEFYLVRKPRLMDEDETSINLTMKPIRKNISKDGSRIVLNDPLKISNRVLPEQNNFTGRMTFTIGFQKVNSLF
jgi:hypothetical protein